MASTRSSLELAYGKLDHERYYDSLFKHSGSVLVDHFRDFGSAFSYIITNPESDWLTKRGVQLHPSPVLTHTHPVCKMIENHFLFCVAGPLMERFSDWTIMSLRKNKFLKLTSLVQKGCDSSDEPSIPVNSRFTVINQILGSKDVYRYSGYEKNDQLKYEVLPNSFSRDFSSYPQGSSIFIHDELHFWDLPMFRKFLKQVKPEIVAATVVFPVEALAGYSYSLNPEAYTFEVIETTDPSSFGRRERKIIFSPDGAVSQSYVQPLDMNWLFRSGGFEVVNEDDSVTFYSCVCIQTIGAHHLFVFERNGCLDAPVRSFGENDAADVSEFASLIGLEVPDCYVNFSTLVDIVNYEFSLKKMSVESAVTKFRLKKIQRGSMVEEMFFLREVVRQLQDLQPHPGSVERFGDLILNTLSGGVYDRRTEREKLSKAILSIKPIKIAFRTKNNTSLGGWVTGPKTWRFHSVFKRISETCGVIADFYKVRRVAHLIPRLINSQGNALVDDHINLVKYLLQNCENVSKGDRKNRTSKVLGLVKDGLDKVNGVFLLCPSSSYINSCVGKSQEAPLLLEWYPLTESDESDTSDDDDGGSGHNSDNNSSSPSNSSGDDDDAPDLNQVGVNQNGEEVDKSQIDEQGTNPEDLQPPLPQQDEAGAQVQEEDNATVEELPCEDPHQANSDLEGEVEGIFTQLVDYPKFEGRRRFTTFSEDDPDFAHLKGRDCFSGSGDSKATNEDAKEKDTSEEEKKEEKRGKPTYQPVFKRKGFVKEVDVPKVDSKLKNLLLNECPEGNQIRIISDSLEARNCLRLLNEGEVGAISDKYNPEHKAAPKETSLFQGNFEIDGVGFFGCAGSGKTRKLLNFVKEIKSQSQVLCVSPVRLLKEDTFEKLSEKDPKKNGRLSCCTYEVALMKDLGFYNLIFIDEVYMYIPGYVSMLTSLRASASRIPFLIVLAGDPMQSRFHSPSKSLSLGAFTRRIFESNFKVKYLNKSYRCGPWIESFVNGLIGFEDGNPTFGKIVTVDEARDQKYRHILVPERRRLSEVSMSVLHQGGVALTMKQCQGLTFDFGALYMTKEIFKMDMSVLLVALTRFRRCPDFIFEYGVLEGLQGHDCDASKLLIPAFIERKMIQKVQGSCVDKVDIKLFLEDRFCPSLQTEVGSNPISPSNGIHVNPLPDKLVNLNKGDVLSKLEGQGCVKTRWSRAFFFSDGNFQYGHDRVRYPSLGWPSWINELRGLISPGSNSCLVNVYDMGSELPMHRDDEPVYDVEKLKVDCLSLGDCLLYLSSGDGKSIPLNGNQWYSMPSGFQVNNKHGVKNLSDRVSLTFRKQIRDLDGSLIDQGEGSKRNNDCLFRAAELSLNLNLLSLAKRYQNSCSAKGIIDSYKRDEQVRIADFSEMIKREGIGCYLADSCGMTKAGQFRDGYSPRPLMLLKPGHVEGTEIKFLGPFDSNDSVNGRDIKVVPSNNGLLNVEVKPDLNHFAASFVRNMRFCREAKVGIDVSQVISFHLVRKRVYLTNEAKGAPIWYEIKCGLSIHLSTKEVIVVMDNEATPNDIKEAAHNFQLLDPRRERKWLVVVSDDLYDQILNQNCMERKVGNPEEKLSGDVLLQSSIDISDQPECELPEERAGEVDKQYFSQDFIEGCFELLRGNHTERLEDADKREATISVGNTCIRTEQFKNHGGRDSWCFENNDQMNFEMIYPRHSGDDGATFLWAIKKRLRFSNFQTEYRKFRRARERGKILKKSLDEKIKLNKGFDEVMFHKAKEEFEKCRYANKSKELLNNHADRSEPDWDETKVKNFLKSQLCTKNDNRYIEAKAGQTIACFAHSILLKFGPYAKYMEMKLNEALPEKWYIHSGKNFEDLNDFVKKNFEGPECVESDFKAFDASQDADMLNFEVLIMEDLGLPNEIIESYILLKCTLGSKLGSFAIMRFTGEFGTFLFNTLVNIAYTNCRYEISSSTPIMFAGDDMCILKKVKLRHDHDDYLASLTLQAKVEIRADPTFCGWRLTEDGIYKHHWLVAERLLIAKEMDKLHLCVDNYFLEFEYALRLPDPIMCFTMEEVSYFSLLVEVFDGLSYLMTGESKEKFNEHRASEPRNLFTVIINLGNLICPRLMRARCNLAAMKALETLAFHFEYDWAKGGPIPGWIEILDEAEFSLKAACNKDFSPSDSQKKYLEMLDRCRIPLSLTSSVNPDSENEAGEDIEEMKEGFCHKVSIEDQDSKSFHLSHEVSEGSNRKSISCEESNVDKIFDCAAVKEKIEHLEKEGYDVMPEELNDTIHVNGLHDFVPSNQEELFKSISMISFDKHSVNVKRAGYAAVVIDSEWVTHIFHLLKKKSKFFDDYLKTGLNIPSRLHMTVLNKNLDENAFSSLKKMHKKTGIWINVDGLYISSEFVALKVRCPGLDNWSTWPHITIARRGFCPLEDQGKVDKVSTRIDLTNTYMVGDLRFFL